MDEEKESEFTVTKIKGSKTSSQKLYYPPSERGESKRASRKSHQSSKRTQEHPQQHHQRQGQACEHCTHCQQSSWNSSRRGGRRNRKRYNRSNTPRDLSDPRNQPKTWKKGPRNQNQNYRYHHAQQPGWQHYESASSRGEQQVSQKGGKYTQRGEGYVYRAKTPHAEQSINSAPTHQAAHHQTQRALASNAPPGKPKK